MAKNLFFSERMLSTLLGPWSLVVWNWQSTGFQPSSGDSGDSLKAVCHVVRTGMWFCDNPFVGNQIRAACTRSLSCKRNENSNLHCQDPTIRSREWLIFLTVHRCRAGCIPLSWFWVYKSVCVMSFVCEFMRYKSGGLQLLQKKTSFVYVHSNGTVWGEMVDEVRINACLTQMGIPPSLGQIYKICQ